MAKTITRTIRVCVATVMVVDTSTGITRNEDFTFPFETADNTKILKHVSESFLHLHDVPVAVQGLRIYDKVFAMPIDLFISMATESSSEEVKAL